MIKFFINFIILIFLSSCMIIKLDNNSRDSLEKKLALESGGFLSSDQYNEISPFLVRINNKTYLFFSSDISNSYDIYYAEMNDDGKFKQPVRLTNEINKTNYDEIYPVVFKNSNYVVMFYIALSHDTNYGTNFVYCAYFDENLKYSEKTIQSMMELKWLGTLTNLVINSYNYTNILSFAMNNMYYNNYIWNRKTNYVERISGIGDLNIAAVLTTTIISNKKSIVAGIITNSNFTMVMITNYRSSFNDKDVFIDPITYKVYFSSDRNGKGNYDLYRYNLNTFDKITNILLSNINISNFYPRNYLTNYSYEMLPVINGNTTNYIGWYLSNGFTYTYATQGQPGNNLWLWVTNDSSNAKSGNSYLKATHLTNRKYQIVDIYTLNLTPFDLTNKIIKFSEYVKCDYRDGDYDQFNLRLELFDLNSKLITNYTFSSYVYSNDGWRQFSVGPYQKITNNNIRYIKVYSEGKSGGDLQGHYGPMFDDSELVIVDEYD